jgi:hypothetical protein
MFQNTAFRRLESVSVFKKTLTQLGQIDRASPYPRSRSYLKAKIQSSLRNVLKYKQDSVLDKNTMMDNVQKHKICRPSWLEY